ncbi:MAG: D-alanyl-D-alanine carboxypeptidase family protein [Clostridia bacterium]|nr:D-alanyl-D-alanine carboxypeptidase family protein [Clostridia bacterium]
MPNRSDGYGFFTNDGSTWVIPETVSRKAPSGQKYRETPDPSERTPASRQAAGRRPQSQQGSVRPSQPTLTPRIPQRPPQDQAYRQRAGTTSTQRYAPSAQRQVRPQKNVQTPQRRYPAPPQRNALPPQGHSGNIYTASGTLLNERQRALYEKAFYEKYGRSPYVGKAPAHNPRPQASPRQARNVPQYGNTVPQRNRYASAPVRQDRRQAFLEEERIRKLEEASRRAALEQQRLAKEAEEARRRAREAERQQRELERQYEAREKEKQNLRRYNAERKKLEEKKRREEEERRIRAEQKRQKLIRRRHVIRVVKFHTVLFAAAVLFWAVVAGFIGYSAFYKDGSDESRSVSYYFDGEKYLNAASEQAYCNGELCVNFTDLAKYFGFYTAGDSTSLKYVIPHENGADDVIEFVIGSTTAIVNGTPVTLPAESRYYDSSLWVSYDVADFFKSGVFMDSSRRGRVEMSRITVKDEKGRNVYDDEGNKVYEAISLRYGNMFGNDEVDLVALYGDAAKGLGRGSKVDFFTDLSAYEDYMNPVDSNEFLVLINRDNPVDASFLPPDLTALSVNFDERLRFCAERSLEAMFAELHAAGFDGVTVTDGFRSYAEQSDIFANAVYTEMAENALTEYQAKGAALAYAEEAGTSDHQTALAVDLNDTSEEDTEFAATKSYEWLIENSWKFGYIPRYPADKADITGRQFEPYHFRFVGRFAAEIIHNNGWCLEEYILKG